MTGSGLSDILRDINFQSFFGDLQQYGWFQYVFPFLLVYSIVFTILNQVELFRDKKPVKVIVAAVFGLFAIAFPLNQGACSYGFSNSSGCTLGDLMMLLFPKVTALTMGILCLYIIAAMLGVDLVEFLGKDNDNNAVIRYSLGAIGLLIVGYYFGIGMDWWSSDFKNLWLIEFISDPLLWVIVVFAFFFWYISKDEDDEDTRKLAKDMAKGHHAEHELKGGHH